MGDEVNRADPFRVQQRDDLPELSAEEREGLIRVGATGGRIRNRDLPNAVGLLDLRLVIPYRPGMVQLSADLPDLAAMHAWSLRLLDRGTRRRRGMLRLLR